LSFLGIDLGTTNCGFAWIDGQADENNAAVQTFAIPQLVGPGEVHAEPLLESCLYLSQPGEFAEGALDLPWRQGSLEIAGRFAHRRGAETLGRLVTSAKSWLCHTGADRTAAILPANAPDGAPRISPLDASRRYLEHLREAWDDEHPEAPFSEQSVVLTVPASFDAVARELTERAAQEAGFRNLVLLEEPQAAFYAWLDRYPDWREHVGEGDLVLVIDVGGGTTDFTLVAIGAEQGELRLNRVAVGDHLLLGGDNMDLALAHSVAAQLASTGRRLDQMQMHGLWQQCRAAKERLLSNPDSREETVSILGRGSSLIGGSLRGKLTRDEVERLLIDGFFPVTSSDEMPQRRKAGGLMEVGLPYEPDPAITRHLARFLRQEVSRNEPGAGHGHAGGGYGHAGGGYGRVRRGPSGLACPTHVLLNGGVFQATLLRDRVMQALNSWLAAEGFEPAQVLPGEDLMHAVARGAAVYGKTRAGHGIRIRGGVPRTYYVGVESSMPAVPGITPPLRALTVAPFGMEEGTGAKVPAGEFSLVIGEPAEFRFFSSSSRRNDELGAMVDDYGDELEELAPIQVCLPAEGAAGNRVRVTLETNVTETGTLELWCAAQDGRRWKLEFQVRETRRAQGQH
jgi:hypothetical protein